MNESKESDISVAEPTLEGAVPSSGTGTLAADNALKSKRRAFVTALTLARAPLVAVAAVWALCHALHPTVAGLVGVIFCMALGAVTDLLDGWLARRWEVVSRFGALADPLMDKIFYVATLPVAVFLAARLGDWRHAVLLLALDVISMMRDQWVTFLRSVGSIYGADVRANWSGKLRTALGFPVVLLVYLYLGVQFLGVELPAAVRSVLIALELALIAVTLISAGAYTREYFPHLRRSLTD